MGPNPPVNHPLPSLFPPQVPKPGEHSDAPTVSNPTPTYPGQTEEQDHSALHVLKTNPPFEVPVALMSPAESLQRARVATVFGLPGAYIRNSSNATPNSLEPNPFHALSVEDTGTVAIESDRQTSVSAVMEMRRRPLLADAAQVILTAKVAEASLLQLVKNGTLGAITSDTLSGGELNLRIEWLDVAFAAAFYSGQVLRYFADPDLRENYLKNGSKQTVHALSKELVDTAFRCKIITAAIDTLIVKIEVFLVETRTRTLAQKKFPGGSPNPFANFMYRKIENIDKTLFSVIEHGKINELKNKFVAAQSVEFVMNLKKENIAQQFGDQLKTNNLIKPAIDVAQWELSQTITEQWYKGLLKVNKNLRADIQKFSSGHEAIREIKFSF